MDYTTTTNESALLVTCDIDRCPYALHFVTSLANNNEKKPRLDFNWSNLNIINYWTQLNRQDLFIFPMQQPCGNASERSKRKCKRIKRSTIKQWWWICVTALFSEHLKINDWVANIDTALMEHPFMGIIPNGISTNICQSELVTMWAVNLFNK